ncbi:MAG: hypothetical protein KBG20_15700 [Caldilineaceae bacterium]|nr:hypothetical protein [Caldilineaceae bacterium]MBP8108433.1 hypothetical protein [Caldilineaceae bacterium]MBP8123488.1 hypothetical protein [Caldilineaceae bacterium]MBP9073752.1 hypothetical protein [Caldilineaceae bacterium]
MTPATFVSVVEADYTVKAPSHLQIGEQVLVLRMPSAISLLADATRRRRFAATRQAIQNAMHAPNPAADLSDEEIVALVKRARRATKSE